ncbi:MAG: hypothetical protein HYT93_00550 [Parcubacteria group bacterium]|nr:hypothetical protein [Parcubacteria group bacterium]
MVGGGIEITHDNKYGDAVVIGKDWNDKRGWYSATALCKKFPPKTDGGVLFTAHPFFCHPKKEESKPFWVLRDENEKRKDDTRALVVVDCSNISAHHLRPHGIWCTLEGHIVTVASGRTINDDGVVYAEDLVIMYPGSSASVRFVGNEQEYLLRYDDPSKGPQLEVMP